MWKVEWTHLLLKCSSHWDITFTFPRGRIWCHFFIVTRQHNTKQSKIMNKSWGSLQLKWQRKTRQGDKPFHISEVLVSSQDHFYSWLCEKQTHPWRCSLQLPPEVQLIHSTLKTLLCTHDSTERNHDQLLFRGSTTPASLCFPHPTPLPLHSRLSGVGERFQSRESADELEVTRVWNCPALTLEACTHRDKCGAQPLRLATRQPWQEPKATGALLWWS